MNPRPYGRKRLSGQGALITDSNGWAEPFPNPVVAFEPSPGPDVILAHDADAGSLWDDLTRAA